MKTIKTQVFFIVLSGIITASAILTLAAAFVGFINYTVSAMEIGMVSD